MNRESSRRRVFIAAAGLATSVVIAGCGHARGERATSDASANPPSTVESPPPASVGVGANASSPKSAVNASVTGRKSRVSAIRHRSYSVSAVPEEHVTVYESPIRTSVRADVTDPIDNAPSPAPASAVAVCFAPVTVSTLEYQAGTPDAIHGNDNLVYDDFEAPKAPRSDQSMAPRPSENPAATVRTEVTASAEVPVATVTTTSRPIVPCMTTGEKHGVAAGAFLNDAQVVHAALMANSIDSAVSAAAMVRTRNPLVRDYANMMVRDHTAGNQKLAELIDRLKLSPAENDLSNDMLRDVAALSESMPPAGMVAVATPAPAKIVAPADTMPAPDRDTLHLSNRFVAVVNMQPWSSLLAGTSGSGPATTTTIETGAVVATPAPDAAAGVPPVTDFDRRYADYQVRFHQKVLDALDTRLIPWAGPEERAALEEARPTVAAHLEAARNLQRALTQPAATH